MPEYVEKLERLVGPRIIQRCPRFCDWGHRGMDNCNTCDCTGSGFYCRDEFYGNSEEGWKQAYELVRTSRAVGNEAKAPA